jgi:putative phosphoesterase
MEIAVIADTHVEKLDDLPDALLGALIKADMTIHLGDFESVQLMEELQGLTAFRGVAGNHDLDGIKRVLPRRDIIAIEDKKLGIIHGHGCYWPYCLLSPFSLRRGLSAKFQVERPDAILYGHTHVAIKRKVKGTLFFNPGSVCGRFPAAQQSFGMLHVDGRIDAEIVPIMYKNNYYVSWPVLDNENMISKENVRYNTAVTG